MAITTTGSIYHFKDDLGNPLIGGKVYTYEYNTSQPKDTYKTGARITPHKNPIILDDTGSVEWYLIDDYTIRVFDADDVFIEEQDIVTPTKVRIDQLSDSFDLLKSELKDAAYKEVGIEPEKIPLNSNLGTAAYKSFIKDANGFIREEGSTSEVVIKDAAGVATANGIQAGVGAPKIAYKKFVLPSGTSTVAHGLNRNKILGISGVYVSGVERYPYAGAKVSTTILDATQNSVSERHILITYEV